MPTPSNAILGSHCKANIVVRSDSIAIQFLVGYKIFSESADLGNDYNNSSYWSQSYQQVKSLYKGVTGKNVDTTKYDIRYIFQVFNADGSANKEMQYVYSDAKTVTFPVRLIAGRDYNFVVWADIVKESEKVDLVINLEQWDNNKMYDRLGLDEQTTDILGISVPSIVLPVSPGRNLSVVIEVAAMNNRQKRMGYNTAEEFNKRLMESMGLN